MADTNVCDVAARAEILDIKQRLTDAEEAIVGKAEVVHAHSAADYVGATEDQLAAIEALAAALEENGDVLTAYAPVDHTHDEYVTADYVTEQVEAIDLSEYYTRTETDECFATIGYVDDAVADIDIPEVDLTDYVTKNYLTQELNEIALSGEYEVDLSIYAFKTDIPTVPTNVSAFANDAGYLVSADVSQYQTAAQVQALIDSSLASFGNAEDGEY